MCVRCLDVRPEDYVCSCLAITELQNTPNSKVLGWGYATSTSTGRNQLIFGVLLFGSPVEESRAILQSTLTPQLFARSRLICHS
jgi:hypothetical protein